jgi:putative transposase
MALFSPLPHHIHIKLVVRRYPTRSLFPSFRTDIQSSQHRRTRPLNEHKPEDGRLVESIQIAYHANRRVYGSPRIYAELQAQGIRCSRKRVARLMREQGLCARRRRHRIRTTITEPGAQVAPNLLNQDFTATHTNEKWTGDITAGWTYEGWLYFAAVLDLFS